MTKDVWITVSGYHKVDGEAQEPVITEVRGKYALQGGKHYLRFEEPGLNDKEPVNNLIKFRAGCLDVIKKGAVNSNMHFEKGQMSVTRYQTPAGLIEIGVEASDVTLTETPRRITVSADYELHAGGQKVQDSRVEVTVIPYPIV